MFKSKFKQILPWPPGIETADVSIILRTTIDLLKQGYEFVRNDRKDFEYEGYDTPDCIKACDSIPADERFKADNLAYHEERDRDFLTVVLQYLFNLGVEQGARVERENTQRAERHADRYREMWEEECRKNAAGSRLNNVSPLT